jgi:hypothetical protein
MKFVMLESYFIKKLNLSMNLDVRKILYWFEKVTQ